MPHVVKHFYVPSLGASCSNNLRGKPKSLSILKLFVKHAFREVTCGFCKGTIPGSGIFKGEGTEKGGVLARE